MRDAEEGRNDESGWPEADPLRKGELGIAPANELLEKGYRQEHHRPKHCEFQRACAVYCQGPKIESVNCAHHSEQQCEGENSPQCPYPEVLSEGLRRQ